MARTAVESSSRDARHAPRVLGEGDIAAIEKEGVR
jgi:hypothetical protein